MRAPSEFALGGRPTSFSSSLPQRFGRSTDPVKVLQDDPDDAWHVRQVVGDVAQLEWSSLPTGCETQRQERSRLPCSRPIPLRPARRSKRRDRDVAEDQAERTVIDRIVELRHSGQSYRLIAATLDAEELSPQSACHCGDRTLDGCEKGVGSQCRQLVNVTWLRLPHRVIVIDQGLVRRSTAFAMKLDQPGRSNFVEKPRRCWNDDSLGSFDVHQHQLRWRMVIEERIERYRRHCPIAALADPAERAVRVEPYVVRPIGDSRLDHLDGQAVECEIAAEAFHVGWIWLHREMMPSRGQRTCGDDVVTDVGADIPHRHSVSKDVRKQVMNPRLIGAGDQASLVARHVDLDRLSTGRPSPDLALSQPRSGRFGERIAEEVADARVAVGDEKGALRHKRHCCRKDSANHAPIVALDQSPNRFAARILTTMDPATDRSPFALTNRGPDWVAILVGNRHG